MTTRTIYALYDDREPGRYRYIGQTGNMTARLQTHRSSQTAGIPGEYIVMTVLEVVETAQAGDCERFWIARLALEGHTLTNKEGHPERVTVRRIKRQPVASFSPIDLSSDVEADLMTIEDLAEYLRFHPVTITRMVARGELPAAKVGRHWRFRRQDIDAYIERKVEEQFSHTQESALAGVMA